MPRNLSAYFQRFNLTWWMPVEDSTVSGIVLYIFTCRVFNYLYSRAFASGWSFWSATADTWIIGHFFYILWPRHWPSCNITQGGLRSPSTSARASGGGRGFRYAGRETSILWTSAWANQPTSKHLSTSFLWVLIGCLFRSFLLFEYSWICWRHYCQLAQLWISEQVCQ